MSVGIIGQAIGLFVATNIDDLVVLALFFGRAPGRPAVVRIVAGQYLGFAGILAISILGALGAGLLPDDAIPYLGLLPLLLGLRAAWSAWRDGAEENADGVVTDAFTVAAVTLANGGDNIGVYVPVFARTDADGIVTYSAVFLGLVACWCAAGWFVARRPIVAKALSRWGHILLPLVLVGLGLWILIEGGAFGL